jgi:hypothetical protein
MSWTVGVSIINGSFEMVTLTLKRVSIGTLKMGLVMFVWAWVRTGRIGLSMMSLFIIASFRWNYDLRND